MQLLQDTDVLMVRDFMEMKQLLEKHLKEVDYHDLIFFVISKVPITVVATGYDEVLARCDKTLSDLQTDYVDLYLIHWPAPAKHVEAWKALEKLHKDGKAKNIGISNYTIEDYEELKPHITIKPVVNQIEISPLIYRKDTINYFQSVGIRLQAYAILRVGVWKVGGTGGCLTHPEILQVCQKYNRTPAQVIEKWCLQKNIAVIVSSTKKARTEECIQISGFELSQEDIAILDNLTTEDNLLEHKTRYDAEIIKGTSIPPSAVRAKYTIN